MDITDVWALLSAEDVDMLVSVWFDQLEPPTGRAGAAGEPSVAFTGWLGLLGVLSSLHEGPNGSTAGVEPAAGGKA